MKKLIAAIALTIALPAAAFAQTAPNPHAGHNMAAASGQDQSRCMAMNHAGMDHSKMAGMDMQGMQGMQGMNMSGMDMKGMEKCDAKSANKADQAKPSSTPKR